MTLPGRTSSSTACRYGYQGSEKDDELKGEGNSYITHFRLLDLRVGRWFTRDPKETAFESPYVSMRNNPILYNDIKGDTINVITNKGKLLFRLNDGKPAISKLTAKQLYARGTQWFEPTADNYMPIISTASDITTTSAVKHFNWNEIASFAEEDRFMISYRQGGSGDWKAEGKPGDGFLLVEVEGMPYWADAIGQIPFAVDKYTDELKQTGIESVAASRTIATGKEFGDGAVVGGESDNSNRYDNAMIKRAVNWAKERYDAKRVPNGKNPRNGTHVEVKKTNHSPSNLKKPSNVKQ